MKLSSQVIQLNPIRKLRVEDYEINENTIIGVFGESGCGKTSFLQYLFYHNHHNKKLAYMKQDILLHPELTVYETLWFYTILRRKEECANIENILNKMGMTHLSNCRINKLSGGEKKRVMMAHHLLDETSMFILMDEPFSGVDPQNIDLIFSLMLEKIKQCAIIFTAHQLPCHIYQQLTEKWVFTPENDRFYLEITSPQNEDGDTFSDISLSSSTTTIQLLSTKATSIYNQWKYLFLRDRIIDKRNRWTVFIRWTTPLFIILLQNTLIGSFPKYLQIWEHSKELVDLFKTMVVHTILLFTSSIIPMHMLNDHFNKRSIIRHEISQGIYRKNAYLFSAILWDQLSLVLISLCVVLMLMPPDNIFITTFFNVMMEMIYTNMLMWVVSSFYCSSFNITLIIVSVYISIAFIGNLGVLLSNRSMNFIQYISITHIQSNLFLDELFIHHPHMKQQIELTSSFLNTHHKIGYIKLVLMSIAIWLFLPLFMTLTSSFNNNH